MKKKRSRPSCFGSLVLMSVIIIGLKILYDQRDEKVTDHSFSEAQQTESQSTTVSEEPLYDKLYRELSSYATEVTFDYDCTDELFDTFEKICADHPELFWLNGSGTSQKSTRGNDVTVVLTPKQVVSLVDILNYEEEMNTVVQDVLASVSADYTDYEKILYIHDYLVERTDYDINCAEEILQGAEHSLTWQSSSAYGCLVNKLAVCSGYAAAFQLLLTELDIECIRVSGTDLENGTPHEWNCVKLGENWYYVDVTWDDPTFTSDGSAFKDHISHDYFMINEDELTLTHTIDKEITVPDCSDGGYSYYVYFDRSLEVYDFELASEMISAQMENDIIEIKFSSAAEAEKAIADLFDGMRFYDIEAVQNSGVYSFSYSTGITGLLRIKQVRE